MKYASMTGYSGLLSATTQKAMQFSSPPMTTAWSGGSFRDRVRLFCAARRGGRGEAGDASDRRHLSVPGISCHRVARRAVPPTLPIVT